MNRFTRSSHRKKKETEPENIIASAQEHARTETPADEAYPSQGSDPGVVEAEKAISRQSVTLLASNEASDHHGAPVKERSVFISLREELMELRYSLNELSNTMRELDGKFEALAGRLTQV